jgi:hypothetical protein
MRENLLGCPTWKLECDLFPIGYVRDKLREQSIVIRAPRGRSSGVCAVARTRRSERPRSHRARLLRSQIQRTKQLNPPLFQNRRTHTLNFPFQTLNGTLQSLNQTLKGETMGMETNGLRYVEHFLDLRLALLHQRQKHPTETDSDPSGLVTDWNRRRDLIGSKLSIRKLKMKERHVSLFEHQSPK